MTKTERATREVQKATGRAATHEAVARVLREGGRSVTYLNGREIEIVDRVNAELSKDGATAADPNQPGVGGPTLEDAEQEADDQEADDQGQLAAEAAYPEEDLSDGDGAAAGDGPCETAAEALEEVHPGAAE